MTERDETSGAEKPKNAPAERMRQQGLWVDLQVQRAIKRGDFDNLPGAGKPIRGLGDNHDPDWWVKRLVEREQITAVLPAALALRKEDARLDEVLDREPSEDGVRRVVEDFNRRVIDARRQLQGGPPVVTPTRDADTEIAAWSARRARQRARQREQLSPPASAPGHRGRRRPRLPFRILRRRDG